MFNIILMLMSMYCQIAIPNSFISNTDLQFGGESELLKISYVPKCVPVNIYVTAAMSMFVSHI